MRRVFIVLAVSLLVLLNIFVLGEKLMQAGNWPLKDSPGTTAASVSKPGQKMGRINLTKTIMGNSRLPILMFHSVNPVKPEGGLDPYWEWSFRKLADRMHREGYRTITAREAFEYNIKGARLPEKSVWITFDDGWADNLTCAAPILAKYGYVATVFVETAKTGGRLRLTGDQISTLREKYHWDIQSHGYAGHQSIATDGAGGKGSFYNDLKWLPELSRKETMEERHFRVKADQQASIKELERYNPVYCFAYPSSEFGASDEIRRDNDRVMDELGIMGVNVGKWGSEQIVPLNTTSRHRLCRLGIQGDTPFEQIFNIFNFGLYVLVDGSAFNTRFSAYDGKNDRFIAGTADGKIMTFGKDWLIAMKPSPVKKPPGSKRPDPASSIVPTVLSSGEIWVGSATGPALYSLDPGDPAGPALKETGLTFNPRNVVNDGVNLYAFDSGGVVKKIDTGTGEASEYCTLPESSSSSYSGSVLSGGVLYSYDAKGNRILKYDFTGRKLIKFIRWEPREYQLQPWYVLDDHNILTFCEKHLRHVVLEYD